MRRPEFVAQLLDFAWEEWAQLGVSATPTKQSPWCHDPEALLLFSFEVARSDPRLFEELLDWVVTNESLVSTRRLRALCIDDEDRRLVEAVVAHSARTLRPTSKRPVPARASNGALEPLYLESRLDVRDPDPAFATQGFARPSTPRSGKSAAPDVRRPPALALRMRLVLGLGARAEVARLLVTMNSGATVGVLAGGAGYARRNVQEALSALHLSGVVSVVHAGGEPRYGADVAAWAALLGLEPGCVPTHRDWPQLLGAARRVVRWLRRADLTAMSEYLQASAARDMIDGVRDDLAYAGVRLSPVGSIDDVWRVLDEVVAGILAALSVEGPGAPAAPSFGVAQVADGGWHWLLEGPEGPVGASVAAHGSREQAETAAAAFAQSSGRSRVEVFEDDGRFGWRARSPDGRVALVSTQRYETTTAAHRNADRLRPGAGLLLEVLPAAGGGWDVVGPGERRARAHARTQAEAVRIAEALVAHHGIGEVVVHGRTGRLVSRRTVGRASAGPGPDPMPAGGRRATRPRTP